MTVSQGSLEAREVSRRYGHTQALEAASLILTTGEIHGLVGHNGAGKSTLLRILSGVERPDSGTVVIDGSPVELGSPRDARSCGISTVYQELSLVDELTVAQNLFLGREAVVGGRLRLAAMERESRTFLREYGLDIDPAVKVRTLPVATRQLVEVIAALHRNARFLLLDEPTTALEASQVDELLQTIRRVSTESGVGVLIVNHKLDEVFAVADRVTALRNGRVALTGDTKSVGRTDVVSVIVGSESDVRARDTAAEAALRRKVFSGATIDASGNAAADGHAVPAVVAEGLTSMKLRGVSLTARTGRVLGIYGLVDSGRSNLLHLLYGAERMTGGSLSLYGSPYRPTDPQAAIRAGIAFLSEDRKVDGFIPMFTSIANAALPVLPRYSHAGFVALRRAARDARQALASVDVRGDIDSPTEDLSGGNQQKVLFGRVMLQRPRLLLLDEPTKGVDIGAKLEIQSIIRSVVSETGAAAIVVSSEEEEILNVSDDIIIFQHGTCDGTVYHPDKLAAGDLRRLAWVSATTSSIATAPPATPAGVALA